LLPGKSTTAPDRDRLPAPGRFGNRT